MSKPLYKTRKRFEDATEVQKVHSSLSIKINHLKISINTLQIRLTTANKMKKNQAKFGNILKDDYPEVYDEIKIKHLNINGRSPTRRSLLLMLASKINNISLRRKVFKRLKLRGDEDGK